MSEVNYRRNGKKYSSCGPSRGRLAPQVKRLDVGAADNAPKPKSSRERRALKKRR